MKFILEKNIRGFCSKSKAEKKQLRKLALQSSSARIITFFFLIGFCTFAILVIQELVIWLFGTKSFWIELMFLLPIAWAYGLLLSGFIINPQIERIIKEKETEPEA
jgi:hypothetical protein